MAAPVGNQLGINSQVRATAARVSTQPHSLTIDDTPDITSDASRQDIAIELPTAVGNAGIYFTFTHSGQFSTTINAPSDDPSFRYVMTVPGESVVVESDGTAWRVMTVTPESAIRLPTIWDGTMSKMRRATSQQDMIDSLHTLLRLLYETLRDNGITPPLELEDFYGALGR